MRPYDRFAAAVRAFDASAAVPAAQSYAKMALYFVVSTALGPVGLPLPKGLARHAGRLSAPVGIN
jgi:hypothetical protein